MPGEREEPRQLQAESLFAAWASRVESGEGLDFEDLVRANAELEPELRALHEDWKHFAPILGNVVPGLIASGDGLVLPSLTRGPDVDEEPPSDELLEKLGLHAPDTKRYRFRGRIGTGGQGVVLKVWDAKLSRPLAMKIVLGRAEDQPTGQTPRVDGRRLTRFVDEARIASQLNHPGIVPVHELGADESGRAFFTMKLVKGDDLARIFDKAKRGEDGIGLPRAVSYLLRVCEAMAYAHDRGVIHRDLKPANVMVGAYGEVHVMDWGLARVIGDGASDGSAPRARPTAPISQVDSVRRADRETTPGSVLATEHGEWIGTPCYMSPEQSRGDNAAVGPQSDVYAVGAMLYQLLTGTPPYVPPGERVSGLVVLRQTIHGPPPPVESLAPRAIPELVAICERAMARDPAARYASMRALAADLQAFLDGYVVSAYETGAWAETRKWVKRNKALTAAVAATVVVSIVGGALSLWLFEARSAEAQRANANAARVAATTTLAAIRTAELGLKLNNAALVRRVLDPLPIDQRNWEWQFLRAQSDTSVLSELAAIGYGSHVCFAADSPTIAVELDDGKTRVISISGGRLLEVQGRFSSDSKPLNAAGTLLAVVRTEEGIDEVSPERSYLDVWNVDSRERLWSVPKELPGAIYFSENDTTICAVSDSGAHVWEAITGAPRPASPPGPGLDASLVPRAEVEFSWRDTVIRVVARSDDDEKPIAELIGHTMAPKSVALNADERLAASCSYDGSIRVWDATDLRRRLGIIQLDQRPFALRFSQDESRLFVGGANGDIDVYETSDNRKLLTLVGHSNTVDSIEISSDGSRVLTASGDQAARLWDYATGQLRGVLKSKGQVWTARFHPDGTRVLTAGWAGAETVIWDIRRTPPQPLHTLAGHTEQVNAAEWSPDGQRVVTVSGDRTGRLWDPSSGRCIAVLGGHVEAVWHAMYVDSGRWLVTGSQDGIRVWNPKTGDLVRVLEPTPSAPVNIVMFDTVLACTSLGAQLAVALTDNSVRVFDVSSGEQIANLKGHDSPVSQVLFMARDSRLATAGRDGRVKIWDWREGLELLEFDTHYERVTSLASSPSGRHLVSAAEDQTVRIWSTIPHRDSYWNHRLFKAAAAPADELVSEVLSRAPSWGAAWKRLNDSRTSVDAATRRAAMAHFSVRAQSTAQKLDMARRLGAERAWARRLCGDEPWPDELAVLDAIYQESFPIGDPRKCIEEAERVLDDPPSLDGVEVRALVLAKLAVEHHEASRDEISTEEWLSGLLILGRANCRVGNFAEARGLLARVLGSEGKLFYQLLSQWTPGTWGQWLETTGTCPLGTCPFCGVPENSRPAESYFEDLYAELEELHDDYGRPCEGVWRQHIAELDREIAEIEADPDVQIWLREKR